MNELIYIILGAFLAVGGGLLTQRNQLKLDAENEDDRLLWELNRILLDYSPALKSIIEASETERNSSGYTSGYKQAQLAIESYRDELSKLSLRIRTKKHLPVALEVTRFALDYHLDPERLYNLTRMVQLQANPRLIEEYEKNSGE